MNFHPNKSLRITVKDEWSGPQRTGRAIVIIDNQEQIIEDAEQAVGFALSQIPDTGHVQFENYVGGAFQVEYWIDGKRGRAVAQNVDEDGVGSNWIWIEEKTA